jgi:hypothetical protein
MSARDMNMLVLMSRVKRAVVADAEGSSWWLTPGHNTQLSRGLLSMDCFVADQAVDRFRP